MKRLLVTTIIAAAAAAAMAAQQRAADGVALNDEGLPQYSTFSLCAIDPATGQSGASVTTRVPFVGRADAALAASIFHFAETGVRALKQHLHGHGIPVRL